MSRELDAMAEADLRLGHQLITAGWITADQVQAALDVQHQRGGPAAVGLGDILIEWGILTDDELRRIELQQAGRALALADDSGGYRIGRYAVMGEIGRGGMGVVYRGHDPELDRDVAIKMILDPERSTGTARDRLQREAQAVARLRHPGIVAVHEVGEQDGQPYLVMDYIDGDTLDLVYRRGRMPRRRVAEMVRQIALALDHAHRQGIVHRDVKPQNVLVDRRGEPHLLDFGLAQTEDARTHLTRTGHLVGTPQYLSPEQARGDRAAVGPRSDIFSLGALFYTGLVGEPPFDGETVIEVLGRVFSMDPVAPRRLDERIHPDLETIVLRCLEKDPAARYASAGEVAEELRRYLDGEAIVARPAGAVRRARRWARRHPGRVAGLVLGALAFTALGGAAIAHARVTAAESRDAADRERTAIVDSARDDAEATWRAFEAARALELGEEAGPVTRRRYLDRLLALGLEAYAAAHRLGAVVSAEDVDAREGMYRAAMGLGEVALRSEQWSVARGAFDKALALRPEDRAARRARDGVEPARQRRREEHRRAVEAIIADARGGLLAERDGAYEDALFALVRYPEAQTVRLLAGALDEVTADLWRATRRVFLEAAVPTPEERRRGGGRAIVGLEEALDRWQAARAGEKVDQATVDLILDASRVIEERAAGRRSAEGRGRTPSAADVLAAAQERALGPHRIMMAKLCCEALGRLGVREGGAIEALGRHLAAEHDQARAAASGIALCLLGGEEAERMVLGTRDRFDTGGAFWTLVSRYLDRTGAATELDAESADGHIDRGLARIAKGDLEGAIADFTRAAEIDPMSYWAFNNRGNVRLDLGDFDGAIEDFARAIAIDPTRTEALSNRGNARTKKGDLEGAIEDFGRAIALAPTAPSAWSNRGLARREAGDPAGALADFTRAVELDDRFVLAWNGRGMTRITTGDLRGAVADLTRAIELDDQLVDAWVNRGTAHAKLGEFDAAFADLAHAIELSPRDAQSWVARANARSDAGDLDGALADLDQAISIDRRLFAAWVNRGVVRLKLGDARGALSDLTAAIELDPSNPLPWKNRAIIRANAGELQGAIEDFEKVLELVPEGPLADFARESLEKLRAAQLQGRPIPGGG